MANEANAPTSNGASSGRRRRPAGSGSRTADKQPKQQQAQPKPSRQWRKMDLHLHTPASNDYRDPDVTYLDILRQAHARGLDIIALTDHNTVAGYAAVQKEIERLLWLEARGRLELQEARQLDEYRRILDKLLVLPGFEFTATFGFHILGIFPPETPISYLEHLLLTLRVPPTVLRDGNQSIGATSDVLTAYHVINEAGGIVIAAHVNSANGVAMRGLDFGGQTRIAYTQDPNLHALEATDLEKRGRDTTRRFFEGSKPEYPRPMRVIQSSDAHNLFREGPTSTHLGVGDRVTEILLRDVTFEALAEVFRGNDQTLTRPYRGAAKAVDYVQLAREEGESLVQTFHPDISQRGGHLDRILRDICGMANTNGGTIYIGVPGDAKQPATGIREVDKAIEALQAAITKRFSPEPDVHIDSLPTQNVKVLRVTVQPGPDIPYAIDNNLFYIRDEEDTSVAVRDEIVQLVARGLQASGGRVPEPEKPAENFGAPPAEAEKPTPEAPPPLESHLDLPRTGVEIVESQPRNGTVYHTLRDLRNGSLVKNVTKSSARRLWHYAITQAESGAVNLDNLDWRGDRAVINARQKSDQVWYDLALRDGDRVHVFFGVTDGGLSDAWHALIGEQPGE